MFQQPDKISLPSRLFRVCRMLAFVILSKAKDLVSSATCEVEILRLRLRMTVVSQSAPRERMRVKRIIL